MTPFPVTVTTIVLSMFAWNNASNEVIQLEILNGDRVAINKKVVNVDDMADSLIKTKKELETEGFHVKVHISKSPKVTKYRFGDIFYYLVVAELINDFTMDKDLMPDLQSISSPN